MERAAAENQLKVCEGVERWSGPDDDGEYSLVVAIGGKSVSSSVSIYDAACDIAMSELRSALGGWTIRWAGRGDTDDQGLCTEVAYASPPED